MKPLKWEWFVDDHYQCHVGFAVGTPAQFTADTSVSVEPFQGAMTQTYVNRHGDYCCRIWINDSLTGLEAISLLAHEALHVTLSIFKKANVTVSLEGPLQEPACYELQWILRRIMHLRAWPRKWRKL